MKLSCQAVTSKPNGIMGDFIYFRQNGHISANESKREFLNELQL